MVRAGTSTGRPARRPTWRARYGVELSVWVTPLIISCVATDHNAPKEDLVDLDASRELCERSLGCQPAKLGSLEVLERAAERAKGRTLRGDDKGVATSNVGHEVDGRGAHGPGDDSRRSRRVESNEEIGEMGQQETSTLRQSRLPRHNVLLRNLNQPDIITLAVATPLWSTSRLLSSTYPFSRTMVLSDFYQDLEDQEFEDSDGEAQMYMDALERIAQDENLDDDVDFDYDDEDEDEDEDYVPDDDEDDEPSYTYLRVDPDDSDDASVDETATGSHPLLEIMALLNSGSGLSDSARSALFNRIARSGRASFGNTPQYRPDTISGRLFEPQTEADPRGVKLLQSGDFGATGPWRSGGRLRPSERRGKRRYMRDHVANHAANPVIPNTHGTIVAEYPGVRAYLGQYAGPDYGMFCKSFVG